MNILFLTLVDFETFSEENIYCDLLREFMKNGHNVYCVSPSERRKKQGTYLTENGHLLKLKIGNIQKTNLIEKGISTLLIECLYKRGIRKYFIDIKFDLVIYSTPPITLVRVISYVKRKYNAKSYLLLKDIFPQNTVDLRMLSKRNPIYLFFRKKEKKLYRISDYIGCMSQANVDFVVKNNPYIDPNIVHISPNSIEVKDFKRNAEVKKNAREQYMIPRDKIVFVYGGNLGKPQGISFLVECLRTNQERKECFFVICGTGTEYSLVEKYCKDEKPQNVMLLNGLPKRDYENLLDACDVGLIFLDNRFTIPNFPSRILSYMQKAMPVIACTDQNTDIGRAIEEGKFGFWCRSDDSNEFSKCIDQIMQLDLEQIGERAYDYLRDNYNVQRSYEIIINAIEKNTII